MTELQPTQQPTPAGWYPADRGLRWWDGTRWTEHYQHPPQQPMPRSVTVGGMTNGQHLFHLVMTVCTLGLWSPIWFISAWSKRKHSTLNY